MGTRRWSDIKQGKMSTAQMERARRRADDIVLETNLRGVRELLGKTQDQVAAMTEMTQGELSRAERRADHLVSTLRRYIEALGGEVEILATFGDKKIRLRGV
jgi:hypothetical protein